MRKGKILHAILVYLETDAGTTEKSLWL